MNLFVIMMLLNMALVWLMIYFSICLMIIVLKWYFEITFIPLKKDCADRPFESTSISSLGQHNRWKIFYDSRFEMIYDFHFEMREQNFRTQNYFRQENPEYFIDENTL